MFEIADNLEREELEKLPRAGIGPIVPKTKASDIARNIQKRDEETKKYIEYQLIIKDLLKTMNDNLCRQNTIRKCAHSNQPVCTTLVDEIIKTKRAYDHAKRAYDHALRTYHDAVRESC